MAQKEQFLDSLVIYPEGKERSVSQGSGAGSAFDQPTICTCREGQMFFFSRYSTCENETSPVKTHVSNEAKYFIFYWHKEHSAL